MSGQSQQLKWEGFKNLMGGIQALAITVSIVFGGIWTWQTFNLTLQEENARASLEKLKNSLHKEDELVIQINANQVDNSINSEAKYITGTITIINNGNALASLQLTEGPLMVTPIFFQENGEMSFGDTHRSNILGDVTLKQPYLTDYYIHGDNKKEFPFLVKVPSCGVYYVDFRVRQPERELTWSGSSYVFVK